VSSSPKVNKGLNKSTNSIGKRLLASFNKSKEQHNIQVMKKREEEREILKIRPKISKQSRRLLLKRNAHTPTNVGSLIETPRSNIQNSKRTRNVSNGSVTPSRLFTSHGVFFKESTEDLEIKNNCTFKPKINRVPSSIAKKIEADKKNRELRNTINERGKEEETSASSTAIVKEIKGGEHHEETTIEELKETLKLTLIVINKLINSL